VNGLLDPLLHVPAPIVLTAIGALVFGEAAFFLGFVLPGETAVVYGGVLADAMDRRRLIIAMQIAQLGVTGWLAALTFASAITPTALYVGSVLLAVFAALEGPSRQSIIPNLVPRAELTSAVALNSTQRQLSSMVPRSMRAAVACCSGQPRS